MIPEKIEILRYYFKAAVSLFLLQIQFWEWLDITIRRLGVFAGLIVAVLTVIKLYQDISKNNVERKIRRIEMLRKEEELRRYIEEQYRNK